MSDISSNPTQSKNSQAEITSGVLDAEPDTTAGIHGQEYDAVNNTPAGLNTGVSGGGTIKNSSLGLQLNPGTTAGDAAFVESFNHRIISADRLHFQAFLNSVDTGDDTVKVGFVHGTSLEVGVNLTTGDVVWDNESQTEAGAFTPPMSNGNWWVAAVSITIDYPAGETRFSIRGSIDYDATKAGASIGKAGRPVYVESNGNGDRVNVPYIRQMQLHDDWP